MFILITKDRLQRFTIQHEQKGNLLLCVETKKQVLREMKKSELITNFHILITKIESEHTQELNAIPTRFENNIAEADIQINMEFEKKT
jgi:hypothetical protein